MLASLSLFALTLAGPKPVSGMAVPIEALKGAKIISAETLTSWNAGCYSVEFKFETTTDVVTLAKKLLKIENVRGSGEPDSRWYHLSRHLPDVWQEIILYQVDATNSTPHNGSKLPLHTLVTIHESPGKNPAQWFEKAISPHPPVPMITVPFLPDVQTTSVDLVSLEGLISYSGKRFVGTDASIYHAYTTLSHAEASAQLALWASENGYKKQGPLGSYFKPNVELFEMECHKAQKGTEVVIYSSSKKPDKPVNFIKF